MFSGILITSTPLLASVCEELSRETFVTVDTEFMRESTYYPELCLIQIAGEHTAAAIDPLAEGIDLSPLFALLANKNVLKVMHAARQDMEIFYYLMKGGVPAPVFDTQVAAQYCGFGESVSYGDFIRRTIDINLSKSSRFTDWARRPLGQGQLNYALADVTHLRSAYLKLMEDLTKLGRAEWVQEEMRRLHEPSAYAVDPQEVWRKLKAGNMRPKQLAVLRELARWREVEAQRRNLPRGRILKDETLIAIAASMPREMDDLHHIRGINKPAAAMNETLLRCVREGLESPQESWPAAPRHVPYPPHVYDTAQLLQLLLVMISNRHRILPRLLASRDELEALAAGERDVPPLAGWRKELFGHYALDFLSGALSLSYDPGRREVVMNAATRSPL